MLRTAPKRGDLLKLNLLKHHGPKPNLLKGNLLLRLVRFRQTTDNWCKSNNNSARSSFSIAARPALTAGASSWKLHIMVAASTQAALNSLA